MVGRKQQKAMASNARTSIPHVVNRRLTACERHLIDANDPHASISCAAALPHIPASWRARGCAEQLSHFAFVHSPNLACPRQSTTTPAAYGAAPIWRLWGDAAHP